MNLAKLLHLPGPLVLASQSPRRLALLRQIGCEPVVIPADLHEDKHAEGLDAWRYAALLARDKARAVVATAPPHAVIIGADTIVVVDGEILNKPVDAQDAVRMLRLLSGKTHTVITAVCVLAGSYECIEQSSTAVSFRALSDDEILAYIQSGSPMDKAGSYGIQDDFGAVFVERIEGCYYTIVGLPLTLLYRMLSSIPSNPFSLTPVSLGGAT